MEELLILLSYPIAWGIDKLKILKGFSNSLITKIVIILLVVFVIIVISPISFVGKTLDFIIILSLSLFIFILGLRLKKNKQRIGSMIDSFGMLSLILFPLLLLLFITNPLYYTYKFDISGLTPKSTTMLKKHRLEHYCKNSNFTYPGNHIIVVKQVLIPYLLEMNIGEVKVGKYNQFDLPKSKMTRTIYNRDGTIASINKLSHVLYEIKDDCLIKKEYTNSVYVETNKFKI
ncbi:hypothetical protein [Flammeovirga sp. SJP92]|uniref:hypothetical protein n=1 Tax=Flammeovirga sp. SJP92 TaxID=1775430 RepID=UPI0007889F24|nr:hypothetical protein [Flammeovirga sp. SJP92]KXX66708.1 hypothetical protein AVL50_31190 [Flammeovirga sp. SJP92]